MCIRSDIRFIVGRVEIANLTGTDSMNISNRHLVFWTVMYDTSDLVPPLVYVEDTSLNGTLLERTESDFVTATRMGKDLGPVLLKDGDFLRLPSGVSIRFNGHAYLPQVPVLDEVQQLEIKVRLPSKHTIIC